MAASSRSWPPSPRGTPTNSHPLAWLLRLQPVLPKNNMRRWVRVINIKWGTISYFLQTWHLCHWEAIVLDWWNYEIISQRSVSRQSTKSFYIIFSYSHFIFQKSSPSSWHPSSAQHPALKTCSCKCILYLIWELINIKLLISVQYLQYFVSFLILTSMHVLNWLSNIYPFQRPGCGNDVSYTVSIIRFKLFSSQSDVEIKYVVVLYGCQDS